MKQLFSSSSPSPSTPKGRTTVSNINRWVLSVIISSTFLSLCSLLRPVPLSFLSLSSSSWCIHPEGSWSCVCLSHIFLSVSLSFITLCKSYSCYPFFSDTRLLFGRGLFTGVFSHPFSPSLLLLLLYLWYWCVVTTGLQSLQWLSSQDRLLSVG